MNESNSRVTEISISPISASITTTGDVPAPSTVEIHFKNQSKIFCNDAHENSCFSRTLIDEENGIYENQLYHRFDSVIDVDAVESITIAGVTIPFD